jgi:hypothetical protein
MTSKTRMTLGILTALAMLLLTFAIPRGGALRVGGFNQSGVGERGCISIWFAISMDCHPGWDEPLQVACIRSRSRIGVPSPDGEILQGSLEHIGG